MNLQVAYGKGFKTNDDSKLTVNIDESDTVKKLDDGLWINKQQGDSKASASTVGKITYPDFDGDGTVTTTDAKILEILYKTSNNNTVDLNDHIGEDIREFIPDTLVDDVNDLIGDDKLIFTKDMIYMLDIDQDGVYTMTSDINSNEDEDESDSQNTLSDYEILTNFIQETSNSSSPYKNTSEGWKSYLLDKLKINIVDEKIYRELGIEDGWTVLHDDDPLKPRELGRPIYIVTGKTKGEVPENIYNNFDKLKEFAPDGYFGLEYRNLDDSSKYINRGYKINPDVIQRIYSMCSRDVVTTNRKSPIPMSDNGSTNGVGCGYNEYSGGRFPAYNGISEEEYGCEWDRRMLIHHFGNNASTFVGSRAGFTWYPPICQTTLNRYSYKTMANIVDEINYPLTLGHRSTEEPTWEVYNDPNDKKHINQQPRNMYDTDVFDNDLGNKCLVLYPVRWQVPSMIQDRVYYPLEQGDLFQLTDTIFPMHFYVNFFGGYTYTNFGHSGPHKVGEWFGCMADSFRDDTDQWHNSEWQNEPRGKMNFECGQRPHWGTTQALFVVKEVEWEYIDTVSYERIRVSYDRKRLTKLSLQLLWCNDELASIWGPVGTIHTYPESP